MEDDPEQKNDEDINLEEQETAIDTKRTNQTSPTKEKEPKDFTRQSPAPFIYAA